MDVLQGGCSAEFFRSQIFSWKRAGFLSSDSISFLAFSRSWALPQSHPFPDFPRLALSPFMISILALTSHASWFCFSFGSHCTFTQEKEFPFTIHPDPLIPPSVVVKISVLPRMLSRMMLASPQGFCETAVSQFNQVYSEPPSLSLVTN